MVHALKTLRPYLLDKPFELHTDNASLHWSQQQRHVSHHLARWLNLLAEYQYRVVHIPGRTNPRLPDTQAPPRRLRASVEHQADSELELFAASPAPAPAAVLLPPPRASFTLTSPLPCGRPFPPIRRSAPSSRQLRSQLAWSTQTVPLAAPPRRLAATSFAVMACCTLEVLAVTSCVFQRQGGSVYRCCRSFTLRPWASTSGATRRSRWLAAQCGSPACPLLWRSTSGPALPANASRPATFCQPASSSESPCQCRHAGGIALVSTSLSSLRPCRATTLCRCTSTC